jgi:hypothetical protein
LSCVGGLWDLRWIEHHLGLMVVHLAGIEHRLVHHCLLLRNEFEHESLNHNVLKNTSIRVLVEDIKEELHYATKQMKVLMKVKSEL